MGILNFERLPASPLVGADRATFDRVVEGLAKDDTYHRKRMATRCVQRLLSPLYELNKRHYRRLSLRSELQAPIFIIGHWRSGTTYVHNLLTQDERFGYCTTFQTIFPRLMLRGYRPMRHIAGLFIPSSRAADGMPLGVDTPQEEEVALSNMTPLSFYHALSSPQRITYWRERALLMNGVGGGERALWRRAMRELVATALHVQQKDLFLSKNPPHTARIAEILRIWPDARFLYLVRNPYAVFESTCNFFSRTIRSTTLESFDLDGFEREVLITYKALIERYERDKLLIRSGNLFEARFEDFVSDPVAMTEQLYRALSLGGFERVGGRVAKYVASIGAFRQNGYTYSSTREELVERWCGDTLRRWNYSH